MTRTLRNEIINAVSYNRNAVPSYQVMWKGQWFGSDDPKKCVDQAIDFDSVAQESRRDDLDDLANLDQSISKIDPDVDPGHYAELVFYRNELEEKLTTN